MRKNKAGRSLAVQIIWRVGALSAIAIVGVISAIASIVIILTLNSYHVLDHGTRDITNTLERSLMEIASDLRGVGSGIRIGGPYQTVMRGFLARHSNVFRVILVAADGRVLGQAQRVGTAPPITYPAQPWLQTDTIYWGEVSAVEAGYPFIRVGVPVYDTTSADSAPQRAGTLLAEIDLTTFWELIREAPVGGNGATYLVDSSGRLLTHPNLSLVGAGAVMDLGGDMQSFGWLQRGVEGGWTMLNVSAMDALPWLIIAERPLWEVLGAFYLPAAVALVLGIGAVWLIMGVMWFVRRRITVPLLLLTTKVDDFRRGDLTGRLHLSDGLGDEIDTLARTFNDMADNIEERTGALMIANARAEESSRLKTEFLATISHELRTPLNAIMGYCGILMEGLSGEMDETATRMVSRIDLNSQQLLSLISELLDLSRIETGEMSVTLQPFDPHQLIYKWDASHRILMEQKGLDFVVDVSENMPGQLYGDVNRITQIVTNLLSNAVKFTHEGEIRLEIRYHVTQWSLTVTDTGIGIPPHALAYIFDKFRQVDGSSTREYGGTGLGLTIVERLTRMMGGEVTVSSEVNRGSRFVVMLPVITRPEEADRLRGRQPVATTT